MGFFGALKKIGKVASGYSLAKKVGQGIGLLDSGATGSAKEALSLFSQIKEPQLKSLALQRYATVADPRDFLTALKDTEFKNIAEDPALKNAQMTALNRFQAIADQGGLTAQDQKLLNDIKTQEKVTEQGQREAIMQNAAQRGAAGSGLEIASQLGAEQAGAQTAAQRGTDVAAQAADRQMQAATLAGNLGTTIRGQEYNMASDAARAQDVINAFNTSAKNAAGTLAFQNQQDTANQNVGLENQQRIYNTQMLPQQQFGNQLTLAEQRAAALNKVGAAQSAQADRFNTFLGNMAQAGAKAMG